MGHTKGEWTIEKYSDGQLIIVTDEKQIAEICEVKEDRANARLISAAPDLLEACKEQHEAIDILFAMLIEAKKNFYPSKSGKPWEAIIKGNHAINKAVSNET